MRRSIAAHVWSQYAISVLSLSLSSKHGNPMVELQNGKSMGTGAPSDQLVLVAQLCLTLCSPIG